MPKASRRSSSAREQNREDVARVKQLREDLIQAGEPVWWDGELNAGQVWKREIRQAIKDSYAVVLCFSGRSQQRHRSGLYPEAADAIEVYREYRPGSIFLIPVRLSGCEVPSLSGVRARCRVRLRPLALLRPPCERPTLARGGALLNLLLPLLRDRGTGLRAFLMLTLSRTSLLLLHPLLLLLLSDRGAGLRALLMLTLLRTSLLLLGPRLLSRRPRMALRAFDLLFLDGAPGGRSAMTWRGGAMWNHMRSGGACGCPLQCAVRRGACSRLSAAAFGVRCL